MTAKYFTKKENLPYLITATVLLLAFLISLILFLVKITGSRRVFIFPSADKGSYILENRYLSNKTENDKIEYFINELLLGSSVERTKLLFTKGTTVKSCFLRDNTLYLNLSSDLLQMGNNVVSISEGTDLLKKNVTQNFHQVKDIILFVDGKLAYSSSSFE